LIWPLHAEGWAVAIGRELNLSRQTVRKANRDVRLASTGMAILVVRWHSKGGPPFFLVTYKPIKFIY
jgi:hypothetical protein